MWVSLVVVCHTLEGMSTDLHPLAFNNFALGLLSPSEYMNEVEKFTLYFVYLFIAKFVLVYTYSLGASGQPKRSASISSKVSSDKT
jgi:hypothetical protein